MDAEEIRIKVEKLERQAKRFGEMTVDQLRDRIEELEAELTQARERIRKVNEALESRFRLKQMGVL